MNGLPRTAIVLAAGLGTRMRPITDHTPKPLVEVAGRTLIDRALDTLVRASVRRAVVNVHHLADQMEAHLAGRTDIDVTISDERGQLMDSGGGVAKAAALIEDDAFLLLNSDTFWIDASGTSSLGRLAAAWNPDRMDLLLLMVPRGSTVGHTGRGDFAMDREGGPLRWDREGAVYGGAAIMSRRILSRTEEGPHSFRRYFDAAMEADRLCGVTLEGLWLTVGTPDAIVEAERAILAHGAGASSEQASR